MRSPAVQRAWELFNLRRFDVALKAAIDAAGEDPQDYEPQYIISLCHANMGRYGRAREAAAETIRVAPERAAGHHAMGLTWLKKERVYGYDEKGRVDPARPPSPELKQAEECYREAIRLSPQWALLWSCYGELLLLDRRPNEAEDAARRLLSINPNDDSGYENLADALRDQWRLDEAEEVCLQGLRLNPESSELHAIMGWIHVEQGLPGKAIAPLRESLRLWPDGGMAESGMEQALKSRYALFRWCSLARQWVERRASAEEIEKSVQRWFQGLTIIAMMFLVYVGFRNSGFSTQKMLILVFGGGFLGYFIGNWLFLVAFLVWIIADIFLLFSLDLLLLAHPYGRLILSPSRRVYAMLFASLGFSIGLVVTASIAGVLFDAWQSVAQGVASIALASLLLAPWLAFATGLAATRYRFWAVGILLAGVSLWLTGYFLPLGGWSWGYPPVLWGVLVPTALGSVLLGSRL